MDTEAIASEIVSIRNRIDEIGTQVEGDADTDVDDERRQLEERLRFLQEQLADGPTDSAEQDEPGGPGTVHYVPPA